MRFSHLRVAATAGVLAVMAAGCGSATVHTSRAADGTPAAFTSASANPVAVPPVSRSALATGTDAHRITETIVDFYRSSWQGQPTVTCGLFTPAGVAGFMHAAEVAFPQGVVHTSTCEHAMSIYSAALGDSATNAEQADPSFSTAPIDNVGVAEIRIHGDAATAIAPTNIVELINPQLFLLRRSGARWYINGSASLNKSTLPQVLARARAKGLLTPKRR
jgi:hypothetical protein